MTFRGAPHGTYCARDLLSYRAATGMPVAPCPNRMVAMQEAMSTGGVRGTYCFIEQSLTTCEAVLDFRNTCPSGNDDCGAEALDDGVCQAGTCTYECGGGRECSTENCAGGATTYCQ